VARWRWICDLVARGPPLFTFFASFCSPTSTRVEFSRLEPRREGEKAFPSYQSLRNQCCVSRARARLFARSLVVQRYDEATIVFLLCYLTDKATSMPDDDETKRLGDSIRISSNTRDASDTRIIARDDRSKSWGKGNPRLGGVLALAESIRAEFFHLSSFDMRHANNPFFFPLNRAESALF